MNQRIKDKYDNFEIQLKLHINKRLYDMGQITEEMYIKAKEYIYKS